MRYGQDPQGRPAYGIGVTGVTGVEATMPTGGPGNPVPDVRAFHQSSGGAVEAGIEPSLCRDFGHRGIPARSFTVWVDGMPRVAVLGPRGLEVGVSSDWEPPNPFCQCGNASFRAWQRRSADATTLSSTACGGISTASLAYDP